MTREALIEDILEAVKRRGAAWHTNPKNMGTQMKNISKVNPVAKHIRRGGKMPADPPWPIHISAVSDKKMNEPTTLAQAAKTGDFLSRYPVKRVKGYKPRLIN